MPPRELKGTKLVPSVVHTGYPRDGKAQPNNAVRHLVRQCARLTLRQGESRSYKCGVPSIRPLFKSRPSMSPGVPSLSPAASSHVRGQEFESPHLHQLKTLEKSGVFCFAAVDPLFFGWLKFWRSGWPKPRHAKPSDVLRPRSGLSINAEECEFARPT